MAEITLGVMDTFEIPEELALELSELLTRQTIRERLLMQLVNDTERYNQTEDLLIPITAKIEAMKLKITQEFVPEKYSDSRYQWNYDGYEVAQNKVQIIGPINSK